ncbi:protein Z-dependent protease inhibitor-like [Sinocyclocheilus anshuiensis]|uniref:Protein Z-dependent protease inhibitor-like n=2 Tax=Sinocyclocheilus TaxID=75365 RepID=A0A671M8C2_9TELE|nr:PREDICTED: protein Z-dependent protease inhibitor-like [Sinocyclocheilus anshuiensis]XP_016328176.1 PREDICTED: protein Z-dependent protease inhibitor-like [Sinocyclocheilus anshuiensis]
MELRVLFTLVYSSGFLCVLKSQEPKTPDVTDLAFKNIDFAMNLYRKISSYHDKNIFFSPLSVSTSFATLLLASKGSTRSQMEKGLNLDSLDGTGDATLIPQLFEQLQKNISQDGKLHMEQGTALFVDERFNVERVFSDQIKTFFGADVNNVDFSKTELSKSTINEYVSRKTGGKVNEMVTSVEPLTQMMLLNTIFFQGDWDRPFDPNSTEISRFYVDKYNIVQVPMMVKEDRFSTAEDRELHARVLRLSYRGGAALLIVLPDATADYTVIDDEISAERFHRWIKNMRLIKMEVHLPKFKMEQSYDLHEILPRLGISSIFLHSANLTGLSKDAHLRVSQVLHKAVIEVDEKGTTAASVTSVGITAYSLPATFIINRPFFFFLYHEATSSLLFMGRVIDPTKN